MKYKHSTYAYNKMKSYAFYFLRHMSFLRWQNVFRNPSQESDNSQHVIPEVSHCGYNQLVSMLCVN